jgi:hypothetical protein
MARWFIECENGSRSWGYETLEDARTALAAFRSAHAKRDPNYSEPVRFVSSDGEVRPLEWDGSAALPHELHPIADPESEEHDGSPNDAN